MMDRAYQGAVSRALVLELGDQAVVPPLDHRTQPRSYDRELYRRCYLVEGFRRITNRFDKLDVNFLAFI